MARVTGNAKQQVFLVGWQFTGHDTGYPALNQVNERVGGLPQLRKLIKDAARYNANISYHINLDDAYPNHPLFDPSVLQLNREGKPFVWCIPFDGAAPDYRISDTKQFRSGYFQRRVQAMLETVPVKETIQLDTFQNTDISVGPDENIGIVAETTYGGKILDWFNERGIIPSTEGPQDAYFGKLEQVLHRYAISDPFHLLMMHGKLYGGGSYREGVGQVLGWSSDVGFSFRDVVAIAVDHIEKYSEDKIADMYYLSNLTQSYLTKKNLVWLGPEKVGEKEIDLPLLPWEKHAKKVVGPVNDFIGRFSDGTVSKMTHDGHWTVIDQGVHTVDGDRRMIPVDDKELVLYSVEGGAFEWTLPPSWTNASISVSAIGEKAAEAQRYVLNSDRKASIPTAGRKAYVVRRLP